MTINKFDDISSLFNGADTAFNLQVSNVNATLPDNRDLDIKVGGVSLFENTDYTVTGSSITFNEAPLAGDLFAGEYVDLNTYVDTSIADLVGSAPDTLNTLSELADALGDNENFSTTITDAVALKADQTALDTTNGDVSTNATAITNLENKVGQSLNTDDNVEFNRVKSDELLVDGGAASPTHIIKGARAGTLVSIDNESTATSAGLLINTASENANTSIIELKSNDASKFTVKGSGDVVVSNGDLDVSGTVTSDALEVRKDTLSTTNSLLKLTNAAGSTTDGVGITLEVANTSGAGGSVNVVRDGSNFKPYMTLNTSSSVSAAPSQRVRIDDTGIDVSGTVTSDGVAVDGNINLGDNNSIYLGDSNDLRIYHDGGSSLIRNTTGSLYIQDDDGHVYIRPKSGQDGLVAIADGAVTLHHSGNAKLETTSNGIDVSGTITSDGLEVNSDGGINLTANTVGRTLIIKPSLTGAVHEFTSDNTAAGYSFSNSSSELMRLNSTGDLDVSGTVTSDGLTVNGTNADLVVGSTGNDITFTRNGDNYISAVGGTSSNLVLSANNRIAINTNGNEAARITSGGDLLVGTTSSSLSNSSSPSITGINLKPNSASTIARDGGTALYLNRISSDGDIAQFRKDGSTVGSIGTQGGVIRVGSGNNNLGFFATRLQPLNNSGVGVDGTIDLGYSTARFKDLYLSGTAYTGGLDVSGAGSVINSDVTAGTALTVKGESGNGLKTQYIFESGTNQYNWQLGFATHASQTFSITPSSSADGTDFTTPALNLDSSGNLDVSGDITVGQLSSGQTANLVINNEGGNTAALEVLSRTNRSILKIADNDTTGYISAEGDLLSIGRNAGSNAANINIDSSNNVAIGGNLDVSGDITADGTLKVSANEIGAGGGGIALWNYNASQKYNIQTGVTGVNNTDFVIKDDTNNVDRLRISNSGDVSISSGNLDVSGDITADGSLKAIEASSGVVARKAAFGPSQTSLHSFDLYNNGSTYLNGTVVTGGLLNVSSNLDVSGDITADSYIQANGNISTGSVGGRLRAGASNEVQLYFDGSHARLNNSVGNLILGSAGNVSISSGNLDVSGDITTDGSISSSGVLSVNSGSANIAATFQSTDGIAGIKLQDSGGSVELSASGSTFRVQPSGGTPVLEVDSTGDVSISSGNLDVSGDITTDGSLGVGTDSPNANLHISDTTAPRLRMSRTGVSKIWEQSIDSSGRLQFAHASSEGGTQTTHMQLDSSGNLDVSGDIQTSTKLITKTTNGEVLRFERESDSLRYSSITANALDGGEAFISFKVHDGVSATSQTDVLHLKGDGNVSISSGNLDVSGDVETDGGVIMTSPDGTRYKLTVANDGSLTTTAV